ncbi:hypothetical protein DVH24_021877, partial [Malus domestica]
FKRAIDRRSKKNHCYARVSPEDEEGSRLLQNPKKHSSALSSLHHFLRQSPPHALQPSFETSKKLGSEEKLATHKVLKMPHKVSDSVVECCFSAWKNYLRSVLVVVLKKLTYGALLSPSDASEEFCKGIFKCFRELHLNLLPRSAEPYAFKQIFGVLMLLEYRDMKAPLSRTSKYDSELDEFTYCFCSQIIFPLMRSVSKDLEILVMHQHSGLTIPLIKEVAESSKASKREAC